MLLDNEREAPSLGDVDHRADGVDEAAEIVPNEPQAQVDEAEGGPNEGTLARAAEDE